MNGIHKNEKKNVDGDGRKEGRKEMKTVEMYVMLFATICLGIFFYL
jgi:hypothetical protein